MTQDEAFHCVISARQLACAYASERERITTMKMMLHSWA
jgi:hypothetical protein